MQNLGTSRLSLIPILLFTLTCIAALIPTATNSNSTVNIYNYVKGIDVSHYQGDIDWNSVKSAGIRFVFIKATDGNTYTDPMFSVNWKGSKSAGITRGAYHFYEPNDHAISQAYHFVDTLVKLDFMDLPPVIDIEVPPPSGISKKDFCYGILKWLKAVEKTLGHKPIIYTYYSFAQEYLNDTRLNSYTIWIADYKNPSTSPLIPNTWRKRSWKIWQFSQSGKCRGIVGNVDLSLFNGSPFDLKAFIVEQTLKSSNSKK